MNKFFNNIPTLKKDNIVIRRLTVTDKKALSELVGDSLVYRYLPTFLYEKKYNNLDKVIAGLYDECLDESIILGAFIDGEFCGLAEYYGLREDIRKISVGYRLLRRYWGQGIATKVLEIMLDYLNNNTAIEIVTASTMVENIASATVLRKNNFELVVHDSKEDWGYSSLILVDKWVY